MSARNREERLLPQIVSTVMSTLELGEVLRAVVRLLSEGTGVNACFVYLLDGDGDRLVLQAASSQYEPLVGTAALERGKGIAWWAAAHREPVFLRDGAAADPRFELVPGIDEERFQSFLAVPLVARSTDVIGVITAHTEAPREFTPSEVEFLVTGASLVAGAIDNARAYDDKRRRVEDLERLTALAEALARATTTDDLAREVARRSVELLRVGSAHVYLHQPATDELVLAASEPRDAPAEARLGLGRLAPELVRADARVSVPLVSSGELVGLLVAHPTTNLELARAIAGQTAVAIQKIRLIERLADQTRVADFLDDLAVGTARDGDPRAGRLGVDLSRPHAVVLARSADDGLERLLRGIDGGTLVDAGEEELRALVPVAGGDPQLIVDTLRRNLPAGRSTPVGVSGIITSAGAAVQAFTEARHALLAATLPGGAPVSAYDALGPLRYLLPVAQAGGVRDPLVAAVERLHGYDTERGTELERTLDAFLRCHGGLRATAELLFVHVNTLRQRLDRIREVSEIDVTTADHLSLALAVGAARLARDLRR